MTVAHIRTVQPHVLAGTVVTIEVDISRGLHAFSIVGLAGKAVDEAKDRVSSAIKHSGFAAPKSQNQKIVVSLSPADLKKEGPLFDVPIAIAYLVAIGELEQPNESMLFVGELGLDGSLRPVRGVLNCALTAKQAGYEVLVVPAQNAEEASLVSEITVIPAQSLSDIIAHLKSQTVIAPQPPTEITDEWHESAIQLEDIKGQESAKRGLLIAAAGRHNVLLVGPPGTGKTMLARALRSLLPPLTRSEALEVTAIHSVAGLETTINARPPFRAPHHTASHTALVGGGSNPKPGEITLAHKGVLFMDEFPEFDRRSLDALRQPLEERVVSISRVQGTAEFPADFILVAALNPYRGQEDGTRDLLGAMQETYKHKISGPILDRIDIWLEVPHVDFETLQNLPRTEGETARAREQIIHARNTMNERFASKDISTNAHMSARDITEHIVVTKEVETILKQANSRLNLSPRSYHRLLKVTRTIADLDGSINIEPAHVLEALQYRVPAS